MANERSPAVDELAQELRLVREELRRLQDREAITDCLYRYSRGLDRHDEEALYSVYHADAVDDHGSFLGRPEEFVPWAHALHETKWVAHTHFITNPRIELDGNIAHVESYVLFVLRRRDGEGVDLGGGRYLDRFERRDGEWRIAARKHVVEWRTQGDDTLFGSVNPHVTGYETGTKDRTDPSYLRPLELQLPAR
jgi:hypothetical protein